MLDVIIILTYLIATLAVGIYKGRGIRNVRDFAISDKPHTTPVLVATIFGTVLDGGATLGLTEKILTVGVVYLCLFFGEPIVKILMSEFIAPRMGRFKQLISSGEVMGSLYGKPAQVITGFAGLIVCIGYLGAQVSAFGQFFSHYAGIPAVLAIVIGAGVVVIYSAFGGIRAITATDVLQFGVIVVTIPVIANVALVEVGGFQRLLEQIPTKKLSLFPEGESKLQYIFLFMLFCMPFLNPAVMQCLLLAKDPKQLRTSMRIAALLDVPFYFTMGTIAFCILVIAPAVQPNAALPYIIGQCLPIGITGLAIAGMLAVIMSTADSYLNAASIAVVNDVIKPLSKKQFSNEAELSITRLFTILIGVFSIGAALYFQSIVDMVISALSVWGPIIVIPLWAGIFGLKGTQKGFLCGVLAALLTLILWKIFVRTVDPLIPSMVVNGVVFFLVSYRFPLSSTKKYDPSQDDLEEELQPVGEAYLMKSK